MAKQRKSSPSESQALRGLSRGGRTVIASIHQPSNEVFELFDLLYLLSGGKTAYFGQAYKAYEFFAQIGFPCPALRNPSDNFLRCVNSDFDKFKATLKGSMKLRLYKELRRSPDSRYQMRIGWLFFLVQ